MPGGRPSGSAAAIRQRVRGSMTHRLGYKVTALFFSVLVWFVVREQETTEELVRVRFAPRVDSGLALETEPVIRALVVGRGRDLLELYNRPPVLRRTFAADTPDTVRLALGPGDVDLPAGVQATVRDVQPRLLTLVFRAARRAEPARERPPAPRDTFAAGAAAAAESASARLRRADSIAADSARGDTIRRGPPP